MNIRAFSKDVKTEAFLNILQLCVSQVREHPDTLETQDQFVAANELSDPEPCNRENKGTPVRAQMSLSQHFPEISNWNGYRWKPLLEMTILAPIWQQSNYFSDPVMGESVWIHNSPMLLWMLTFSHSISVEEDNLWLKQPLRQLKEFQKSNLRHLFGSDELNPQIPGCNSSLWCFKFRIIYWVFRSSRVWSQLPMVWNIQNFKKH